ncbi:MAG: transcription termination factor Rho [Gemmatimonadetes bacterium]|nr:transcription termination factor Rho [Gemmatimonadota bacterium]
MSNNETLGVLEILGNGAAFIRRKEASYTPGKRDVYVGPKLIRKYHLRTGDEISGTVGKRPRNGKSAPLEKLDLVNGRPPESLGHRAVFKDLGAQHPKEQLTLECGRTYHGQPDETNRVIDLLCPFGKGQRALIVSPPKAGKTTILQAVAEGIATNYPECALYIVLVDERPEEVTEMESTGFGEVVASSFDHPPSRHVAVAEMCLQRARRRVEMGEDVVIILDSITRLARAHNTVDEGSGKTLSGGLDATSMERPKRFLGSARSIDASRGGGSLSIIATALVDTGSKMDQVIFEEFKGTGNSELLLSRELADRRIYPAIDLLGSATRREELLLSDDALTASHVMRRELSSATPVDAMKRLLSDMKATKTNDEFVNMVVARSR